MSASCAPAVDAIAFQLAAALEDYGSDVERMVDTWLDIELYRVVSDRIEEIRRLSGFLPSLSVHWVELLIAHSELVHALWRMQQDGRPATDVQEVRVRHAECVASLRRLCLRQLMERRP